MNVKIKNFGCKFRGSVFWLFVTIAAALGGADLVYADDGVIYTWKNKGTTNYGDVPPTQIYNFQPLDEEDILDAAKKSTAPVAAATSGANETAPVHFTPPAATGSSTAAGGTAGGTPSAVLCTAYRSNISYLQSNQNTPNAHVLIDYYQTQLRNLCQ